MVPRKVMAGYGDRLSIAAGESLDFKVSVEVEVESYRCDIVRLVCTDEHREGPGLVETVVDAPVNRSWPARRQSIHMGSYARVPAMPALESFTLQAWIWPTRPRGRQAIVSQGSALAMGLDETGALALDIGGERFATGRPLLEREWVFVAASYDAASGAVRLIQTPMRRYPGFDSSADLRFDARPGQRFEGEVRIAARGVEPDAMAHQYNGKIDRPRIAKRALESTEMGALGEAEPPAALAGAIVGFWDFARDTPSARVVDLSDGRRDGVLVNLPARAMTGFNWTGDVGDWRFAPEQYGAIHFHDDDIYDAGWETDFRFDSDPGMPSGVYAARLSVPGAPPEHVVFFVRPPLGTRGSDVCYLAPTASYLAYGNYRVMDCGPVYEAFQGRILVAGPEDLFLNEHPEYGDSLYGDHSDGSGICYSSRLRPLVNLRPNSPLWIFGGDGYLTWWLEHLGYRADVVTDEDLHGQGQALLEGYRCVVTGNHPEYWSREMWDAMQAYLDAGGRLMYLGGNGFYWRIAFSDTYPGAIEVRRAEDGTRAWEAQPGEYHMSFNGELGGMWRRGDRTPNQLAGVGFTAQGFDRGTYYVREPGSFDARASWIFEGVGADERIGDFGFADGASGQEIDRHDTALGSPPHALVLATSEGHNDNMLLSCEEFKSTHMMVGGTESPKVRSDMVFFEMLGGGAVFSTGSISWIASLAWDCGDNNVSRITRNVLDRFLDPEPFPELPQE